MNVYEPSTPVVAMSRQYAHLPIEIEWSPHGVPTWELLSRHRSVESSNGDWNRAIRMLGTDARLRRVNTLTGEVLTMHPAPVVDSHSNRTG